MIDRHFHNYEETERQIKENIAKIEKLLELKEKIEERIENEKSIRKGMNKW